VAATLRNVALTLLATLIVAGQAQAAVPWPPANGPGQLYVHLGEEHWNDDDSDLTLIQVVDEAARYRPDLVTMSGDKDNDGTVDQLTRWKEIMGVFDRAGVPYWPGVGNHDRKAPPGVLPGTAGLLSPGVQGSLENYMEVFKDRPYPFGDAGAPPGDAPGASSHYYVDHGSVRWIFIDNSCWGISDCDSVQNPPFPDAEGIAGQFEYLERKAKEASDAGKLVFAVMHIPTRDPRDQSYIDTTSFTHVMGKNFPGAPGTPDNERFEAVAEAGGVDAVFVGHIKGQWIYEGRGGIPYYIDGGVGGELYTDGPVGTDHGYWHGFRLVRVDGKRIETDAVPILKHGSIEISGPETLAQGRQADFTATGEQPFKISRKVVLDLRDPDPIPRQEGGLLPTLGDFLTGGGFLVAPAALLLLAGLALRVEAPRRRLAAASPALLVMAVSGVALAQQSEPTSTPKESLPNPARIWTSSNPFVLAPQRSNSEDSRRDPATQTQDGAFRARCPGVARLSITSGFAEAAKNVRVPSNPGRIVRRIRLRGRVARVRLAQPAEVIVRLKRGKRRARELRHACVNRGLRVRWKERARRGRRYRLQVVVRSDRGRIVRSRVVRVAG
jgi:Calcineurin-like phosphoesterase